MRTISALFEGHPRRLQVLQQAGLEFQQRGRGLAGHQHQQVGPALQQRQLQFEAGQRQAFRQGGQGRQPLCRLAAEKRQGDMQVGGVQRAPVRAVGPGPGGQRFGDRLGTGQGEEQAQAIVGHAGGRRG